MANAVQQQSLEERRLAFEERKWADEFLLRKTELEAKVRDTSLVAKLFSPLTATIFAGILTIAGSVIATLLQNVNSLRLEQAKFDATKELEERKFLSSKGLDSQKQQHEMILKMIGVDNVEQARSNLRFLAETQLIADKDMAQRLLAAKETPLIRPATLAPSARPVFPSITPDYFRRSMSEDAIRLIMSYESSPGRPYLDSLNSVIIGLGYGLSKVTAEQLRSDWGPYLSKLDIDRLAAFVGLQDATGAGKPVPRDVVIRREDAEAVLIGKVLPSLAVELERKLPNLADLPPDAYGALVSLAFNNGTNFAGGGEEHAEMRKIRELMQAKNFDEIPAQLREMQRKAKFTGIARRRAAEAALFEKGLAAR